MPSKSDRKHRVSAQSSAAAKVAECPKVPVPAAIRQLVRQMCESYDSCVAFDLWGVEYIVAKTGAPVVTLRFNHPGVLRNLLLFRDRIFLTECWLNRYFDFEGAVDEMLKFVEHISQFRAGLQKQTSVALSAMELPKLLLSAAVNNEASLDRAVGSTQRQIEHHYDVGNEFYELMLDPQLIYSCAYFASEAMTLEQAQLAKLDLICRKLRLKPGERLLDVGCGWGGLLRYAVKNYGVTGYGITLSKQQLTYGREAAAREGLSDKLTIELRDYRNLPAGVAFEKIVSVGMIEHVGLRNYPAYFGGIMQSLQPGGLFLCHGITTVGPSNRQTFSGKFVRRYIFPGGELANLPEVLHHAEDKGWETVDVDGWRPHYAKTLKAWSQNLQSNWNSAVERVGERTAKLWLLYLTASATGFEYDWLRIYQVLLRRHADPLWDLPMTRRNWSA
jgi:cyclopropane-fatty-acyl-phospholipid synthase